MKICFLTKKEKPGVEEAISFTKKLSSDINIYSGKISDPLPKNIKSENYDLLISYISPWIVPKTVLDRTIKWNINFHPGPPEYPGIGCFNFAIYESSKSFGATAHIMKPKVDSGRIIGVKRFLMNKEETVETLSLKTYSALLTLYKNTINHFLKNNYMPESDEKWKRSPYKRSDLEKLATLKIDMDEKEINKRIRATYYPGKPLPFLELFGLRFDYNPDR